MATISLKTFSNAFAWMKKNRISIQISLKFVIKGPIDNDPALVQIMAWRRIGGKPLSEPMPAQSTRGRWVNISSADLPNTFSVAQTYTDIHQGLSKAVDVLEKKITFICPNHNVCIAIQISLNLFTICPCSFRLLLGESHQSAIRAQQFSDITHNHVAY